MSVKIIKQSDFKKEVLESKTPTLVDFYADWCPPCRALAPVLESAQKELSGKVNIVKVNIDESEELARKYMVMSIPTLVVIDGGEEKERMTGFVNMQALIDKVNEVLK